MIMTKKKKKKPRNPEKKKKKKNRSPGKKKKKKISLGSWYNICGSEAHIMFNCAH